MHIKPILWRDKRPHHINMPNICKRTIHGHDRACAELHFNICKETGTQLDKFRRQRVNNNNNNNNNSNMPKMFEKDKKCLLSQYFGETSDHIISTCLIFAKEQYTDMIERALNCTLTYVRKRGHS